MDKMRGLVSIYDAIERWFLIIMTFIMVVVIAAQVFTRYVLGNSLFWSEELGKFIFVWISWIGVSAGMIKNEHIRVTLVLQWLEKKGLHRLCSAVDLIGNLVWFMTSLIVLYYGINLTLLQKQTGVYGAATGIQIWIMYLCLPISGAIVCLRLCPNIWENILGIIGKEAKQND